MEEAKALLTIKSIQQYEDHEPEVDRKSVV